MGKSGNSRLGWEILCTYTDGFFLPFVCRRKFSEIGDEKKKIQNPKFGIGRTASIYKPSRPAISHLSLLFFEFPNFVTLPFKTLKRKAPNGVWRQNYFSNCVVGTSCRYRSKSSFHFAKKKKNKEKPQIWLWNYVPVNAFRGGSSETAFTAISKTHKYSLVNYNIIMHC